MDKRGQDLINRVEAFPKPTVVAIHGACMGAGLEMALGVLVADRHRSSQDPARACPKSRSGFSPARAGASGCRGRSVFVPRWR